MSEAALAHAASLRLSAHYGRATAEQVDAGRRWYPAAARVAAELATDAPRGIGAAGCAAVIAALSPRLRWAHNIADAAAMIRAAGRASAAEREVFGLDTIAESAAVYGLPERIGLAARILAGDALERRRALRGPKVGAFYRAIRGDREAVTVDVWAARAATGAWVDNLTPRRHRIIADAYRRAARRAGESPRDFQAIVWLTVRGAKPSDPEGFVPSGPVARMAA